MDKMRKSRYYRGGGGQKVQKSRYVFYFYEWPYINFFNQIYCAVPVRYWLFVDEPWMRWRVRDQWLR